MIGCYCASANVSTSCTVTLGRTQTHKHANISQDLKRIIRQLKLNTGQSFWKNHVTREDLFEVRRHDCISAPGYILLKDFLWCQKTENACGFCCDVVSPPQTNVVLILDINSTTFTNTIPNILYEVWCLRNFDACSSLMSTNHSECDS